MDLEVHEVSELLRIPEALLHQWIDEGKIPAYRMKKRFLFNRSQDSEKSCKRPQRMAAP